MFAKWRLRSRRRRLIKESKDGAITLARSHREREPSGSQPDPGPRNQGACTMVL